MCQAIERNENIRRCKSIHTIVVKKNSWNLNNKRKKKKKKKNEAKIYEIIITQETTIKTPPKCINESVSCRADEAGDYRDEKTKFGIIKKIKKKYKTKSLKTTIKSGRSKNA